MEYERRLANKNKVKQAYAANTSYRKSVQARSVHKYATNTMHRQAVRARSLHKYATDTVYRQTVRQKTANKIKEKYRRDSVFRAHMINIARIRRVNQPESTRERSHIQVVNKVQSNSDITHVISRFKKECTEGPECICAVCHRLLFRNQVRQCCPEKLKTCTDLKERCITDTYLHVCTASCSAPCILKAGPSGKMWLCTTCHTHLSKNSIPPEAQANSLVLDQVPEQLQKLNTLEQQLVSLRFPFAKVVSLPKGGQRGIKGPVVCVPSDVQKTISILPRTMNDSQIVGVKLKRKLAFKGHVEHKMVNVHNVENALQFLKEHNPLYTEITIDRNWTNDNSSDLLQSVVEVEDDRSEERVLPRNSVENDEIGRQTVGDISRDETDQSMVNEMDESAENDHLRGLSSDTCIQPIDMRTEALAELENFVYSVAPAEGNKPVSIFKEDMGEALAFPTLFPSGINTFDEEREQKLSLCKYYNARLLSADTRFAQNSQYVFYAQYATELEKLLSGISIAMRKGSMRTRNGQVITAQMLSNKERLYSILKADEGFRYMEALRGTPEYWKRTLNDLFAMIRQVGLPTWF
jgi:hypothetical protein